MLTIHTIVEFNYEVDDQTGTISWTSPMYPGAIFATPFWEGEDGIPIQIPICASGYHGDLPTVPFPDGSPHYWDGEFLNEERELDPEFQRYIYVMQNALPKILEQYTEKDNEVNQ